jgi:hypothetical protein
LKNFGNHKPKFLTKGKTENPYIFWGIKQPRGLEKKFSNIEMKWPNGSLGWIILHVSLKLINDILKFI